MPQTIIENWLYTWISKREGEVPGTWILKQTQKYPDEMIWNSVSANRVLWSSISTCARRTPSGVTSVDGGHRGRFTKDEFDMFLGIWRPRSWDKGSQTKGKFQGVVSTLFGGGFGSWRSQLTIFPSPSPCVPITWRLQVERFFSRLFFSRAQLHVSWRTKPLGVFFSIHFPKGLYFIPSINISMPPWWIHFR